MALRRTFGAAAASALERPSSLSWWWSSSSSSWSAAAVASSSTLSAAGSRCLSSSFSSSSSSSPPPIPASADLNRWQQPSKYGVPKYSGLSTLLRAPLSNTLDNLDIALVGVPFDGGASFPGTRHGPREIRVKSAMLRRTNGATGVSPFALCNIADVGDAWLSQPWSGVSSAHLEIEGFFRRVAARGVAPLTAGGDHSVTLPILRAIAAYNRGTEGGERIGIIHLDAHMDTSDTRESEESMGSKYWNGTPFSCAVEEGLIDPTRTIQIGIRGPIGGGTMISEKVGMRVVYMEEFYEMGPKAVALEALRVVGDGPVYITFDVDALDPAYALGTGSPEDGGMSTLEAQLFLRGLRGLNLVGADFVCTSPAYDPTGNTPRVAANMMFEMLCLLAESRARRKGAAHVNK